MAALMSRSTQPRATVLGAFLEGWRRVFHAPGLVAGTWLAATLTTLPLAGLIATAGNVPGADTVGGGPWTADALSTVAAAGHDGPAALVDREIHGIGGSLGTLMRVLDGPGSTRGAVLAAAAVHLLVWTFITGMACDRLARGRAIGARAMAGLGTRYFPRLLRLAVFSAAAYWALFRTVHPLLFGPVYGVLVDLLGRPALVSTTLTILFAAVVALLALVVDFTRVRIVVDDRFSVLATLAAASRFVRRRPVRCAALYCLNLLALAILARLWVQALADLPLTGWAAVAATQLFVVTRVIARLGLIGSEAVFFQGELAHATYTAAPVPRWPESASIEAIRNLRLL